MSAFVYMIECADGSYYVGSTRASLNERLVEHNSGKYGGCTATRRPVKLLWSQEFDRVTDAIAVERQIKGWSRAKKEALVVGEFSRLAQLAKRRKQHNASFETQAAPAPQDEER